jgi:O-succinylhomoserine sulfhydrylase
MSDGIKRQDPTGWRPATRLVRGGATRSAHGETSEGLFLTSGFRYDSAARAEARFKNEEPGFVYSRFGNPTVAMFEERMAQLEGAEAARATASGMAAVNAALFCQLKAGDHVVSARAIFGSCLYIVQDLLPRFGVASTIVDGTDLAAWQAAMRPETKVLFLESPSNPTLDIVDIAGVARIARAGGARLIVDNVFATPMLQHPLALGAHIVMYSATKHIDGQGRVLGGVILSDSKFVDDLLTPYMRHTGPSMSAFNAWVLLKGLETLDLRVRRHCQNAQALAEFLEGRKGAARVIYPGLKSHRQHALAMRQMSHGGPLICLEIDGDKAATFRFLDALRIVDISNNLGDAKSLITHPATTTHQRLKPEERAVLGIGDNMVRLSVGIEDVEDLKEDLAQALAAI